MSLKPKIIIGACAAVVALTSISIQSLPRLSAEHATPCLSCHISPNGGGMRNEFGHHSVAYNELSLQRTKAYFEPYSFKPRLSDNLTFGLDYRLLYLEDGRFFRMQTDFYLALELLRNITYNLTFGSAGVKDSYLLTKFRGENYWLKIGRFYPAFGMRDPDHTAFVRSVPFLAPELMVDGISVGGNFFNGSNITLEFYEPNGQRVGVFHSFRAGALGPVGFLTGVSWRESERLAGGYGAFPIAKSAYGGLAYGRFTGLAEFVAVGKGNEQRAFFAQLATRIVHGLYFLGEYSFHDPDSDFKSGTNEFVRLSCEFFPVPFVELRPSATIITAGTRYKQVDYLVQLHLNY